MELKDACKYIKKALHLAEKDKATADLYASLSAEEMGHADKLHNRVVAVIEQYRKENGPPPADMQWRYDYLHKKFIDKAAKIRVKQALYKEVAK